MTRCACDLLSMHNAMNVLCVEREMLEVVGGLYAGPLGTIRTKSTIAT